jgi:hypothetical protein
MQPILDAILKHVTMMMMMMMLLLLLLLLFMLVVLDSTAERRRQRSVCLICHKVSNVCHNRITCYNYYCSCYYYYYYYDYDYYYYCYLSPLLLSMKHCEPRDFRPHRHRSRGTGHDRNRRSDQIDRHRS